MLSRARRDEEGRLLGRSTLLLGVEADEAYLSAQPRGRARLQRDRSADGAARGVPCPAPGASPRRAAGSTGCARRSRPTTVPIRPDHPVIRAILERTQSASSLRHALAQPARVSSGTTVSRWRAPESGDDPLMLDPLAMGNLVHHGPLSAPLQTLEMDGGLANASDQRIAAAVDGAAAEVARLWERRSGRAPARHLAPNARRGARAGQPGARLPRRRTSQDARAYGEVPFGGAEPKPDVRDPVGRLETPVAIPDTGFRIRGSHRPAGCLGRRPPRPGARL